MCECVTIRVAYEPRTRIVSVAKESCLKEEAAAWMKPCMIFETDLPRLTGRRTYDILRRSAQELDPSAVPGTDLRMAKLFCRSDVSHALYNVDDEAMRRSCRAT